MRLHILTIEFVNGQIGLFNGESWGMPAIDPASDEGLYSPELT